MDLNEFLLTESIFENCFCCGDKKYCEFYHNNALYRVCAKCLKKDNIKNFFGLFN